MDRVYSGVINDLFYPTCVHARKFYVTDSCISCGKCAAVCPLGNVRIEQGKPVWGKLHALYGVHLPLSERGDRVRKAQPGPGAVYLSEGYLRSASGKG